MRPIETKWIAPDVYYMELAGKSTENKPTAGLASGSLYMETDTGNVYVFDETDVAWTKIGGSGT